MPGPVFPTGEAVALRTYEGEDVPFVHGVVNDHRMWETLGGPETPTTLATERRYFEQDARSDGTVKFVATREVEGPREGEDDVVRVGRACGKALYRPPRNTSV